MSEFRRFGTERIGDQVTQNDGNSREKVVLSTSHHHIILGQCQIFMEKNFDYRKFYIEFGFIQVKMFYRNGANDNKMTVCGFGFRESILLLHAFVPSLN